MAVECRCCVRGDGNGISWTYPWAHVFFKVLMVPTKLFSCLRPTNLLRPIRTESTCSVKNPESITCWTPCTEGNSNSNGNSDSNSNSSRIHLPRAGAIQTTRWPTVSFQNFTELARYRVLFLRRRGKTP